MKPPVAPILPKDARDTLVAAAAITNPRERQRAVQKAITYSQKRYPHLFKGTEK